jgi:hypothetical protein
MPCTQAGKIWAVKKAAAIHVAIERQREKSKEGSSTLLCVENS